MADEQRHDEEGSERRAPARRFVVLGALVVVLILVAMAVQQGFVAVGATRGRALRDDGQGISGMADMRPGVQYAWAMTPLTNISDRPLVVGDVELMGQRGFPSSARLVRVGIADRSGPPWMPGGAFGTDPPVWTDEGECGVQEVRPLAEVEVAPGDDRAYLVLYIETVAEGRVRFDAVRVHYEQGRRTYHQDIHIGLRQQVRSDAPSSRIPSGDRTCLHLGEPLPGWTR